MQRGPACCKDDTPEGLYSAVMMVRTVVTNRRRVQCCFHSVNHLIFVRCKACFNHKSTHTCPNQSSLYLSTLSLLVQSAGPQQKGKSMKALSQMHPPKFQLSMTQGTKGVLIHVLQELLFYELVKIGLLMPRFLFSRISKQNTKWKVQDREWGAEGQGLRWQQECWEKSGK